MSSQSISLPPVSRPINIPNFPELKVVYKIHSRNFMSGVVSVTLSVNNTDIILSNYDQKQDRVKLVVFNSNKYFFQGLDSNVGEFNFLIVREPEHWRGPIQVGPWKTWGTEMLYGIKPV